MNLGITKLEASESEEIILISPENNSKYDYLDEYTNNTFSWLRYQKSERYVLQYSFDEFANYKMYQFDYSNDLSDTVVIQSFKPIIQANKERANAVAGQDMG
jgi:hypothetical protein